MRHVFDIYQCYLCCGSFPSLCVMAFCCLYLTFAFCVLSSLLRIPLHPKIIACGLRDWVFSLKISLKCLGSMSYRHCTKAGPGSRPAFVFSRPLKNLSPLRNDAAEAIMCIPELSWALLQSMKHRYPTCWA